MLNYTDEQLSSKDMRVQIAIRLHKERESAGLTLDALADRMGYAKPTVQSWEKGWRSQSGENKIPTLHQLIDLSAIYNCTPEYLLCEYDMKTKPITDICLETGLYPEAVKKLQSMFYTVLENPCAHGANDLFLAFINHFLTNVDTINELIFNRQMLEGRKRAFEEDPYHDDLLKGYNAVCVGSIALDIFKDSAFGSKMLSMQFTEPMIAFYESEGYDKDMIPDIMAHFTEHFEAMSINHIKQSNFALSDSFIDIVESFFQKFPDNVYGSYQEFADEQRSHINPERIKPLQIIR